MHRFPDLDVDGIQATRDALHAYSRVLGAWLKAARPRRKHWWHASLRPSISGLTTGPVRASSDFEIELDFIASRLRVRTAIVGLDLKLRGQSTAEVSAWLRATLSDIGVAMEFASVDSLPEEDGFADYSPEQARRLQWAFAAVAAELEVFRSGIREETSPIQVWPHHFDLSMIWLPGSRIDGEDPADEEYADKQMNFGFVLGDGSIAEPYFYVTAYPIPESLPRIDLGPGVTWRSDGFNGAVLRYQDLLAMADPAACLQNLWSTLRAAGQTHFLND